jgi:endonuclease III related protein
VSSARRKVTPKQTVRGIYRKLSRAWGPQHWWPAESPFEVIVGAILAQNTSWTNVEKAIANLRAADVLTIDGIRGLGIEDLEQIIRPSGYFRQKAARLKEFVAFVDKQYSGSVDAMRATPTTQLREVLLAQKGIGPETADSILLYAGQHPVFVVDAYTRRVLGRHDAISAAATYDEVRELMQAALEHEPLVPNNATATLLAGRPQVHSPSAMSRAERPVLAHVYNEMHGLMVQLGKHYCAKREPKCELCPLGDMLTHPANDTFSSPPRSVASRAGRRASKAAAKPRV